MAGILYQRTQIAGVLAMAGEPPATRGDEPPARPPARVPNLLAYEERADTRTTRHVRTRSKVTTPEIRPNIRRRVDVGAEIVCIRLAVAQMTRGEFECWIALKEGVLFDPLPKRSRTVHARRNWRVVPPPATSATVEQVARHYGYTEGSVKRLDQSARKLLDEIRERAGLIGDEVRVPIWPAVMSDRALLDHLYGRGGTD